MVEEQTARGLSKADRVAVVVNGNAKQVTDELVQVLDQLVRSGDLFVSRHLDEGRAIAQQVVAQGYPVVLTGGGDGTFVQMVTWITREAKSRGRTPPRFGLLKLGTGNSLAWVLGSGRKRAGVLADLARVQRAGTQSLPLLEVQDMLTPFAGAGVDALGLKHFHQVRAAVQRVPWIGKYGKGAFAYAVSVAGLTIPEAIVRPKLNVRIVNRGEPAERLGDDGQPVGAPIEAGEVLYEGPCLAALVSTIPYWGFGARVFPFAGDRDDRFCLRVLNVPPLQLAAHLRSVWKGSFRHPEMRDFLAQDIELYFDRPTATEIGGDPAATVESMRARLYPEPVKVVDFYAPPPVQTVS